LTLVFIASSRGSLSSQLGLHQYSTACIGYCYCVMVMSIFWSADIQLGWLITMDHSYGQTMKPSNAQQYVLWTASQKAPVINFRLHTLVLRRCWLCIRKSIRHVENWVMRCWHGFLPGARCEWFAYGAADATTTPSSLASLKSRLV